MPAPAVDPDRRGLPAPLDNPPFPSADWVGPTLGVRADAPDGYLQKALFRDLLKKSRLKLYGWIDAGFNISTSKQTNIPDAYDIVPNSIQLDQFVVRIERQPDTVQTSHLDWGFRISNVYGLDYRYTTAKGWFSDQLFQHNQLYGYDPVELYAMLYIPQVAEGMLIKVGRYISPPDIEAQLAPDNYLYSHSLMYTYDPFTFTGVQVIIRLHRQWHLELAVHAGNDMAPWSSSAQPNGQAMVRWVSASNNDSLWGGIVSIGRGQFTDEHDNLQFIATTWGHRFSARLHMMTEAYYMWQFDAASGGSCIDGPAYDYAGGGGCGKLIPGRSDVVGAVNYFQVLLTRADYLSIRNDFLWDPQGQRTGFATAYSSHTIGWVHNFADVLTIRPEIRYDRAYADGVTPYDNGTRKDQMKFAMDGIFRF